MKKINRTTTRRYDEYMCEICKEKFYSEKLALNCEKSHSCIHKPIYTFRGTEDSWWFNAIAIDVTCTICFKVIDSVNLKNVSDNQEAMKKIYEIILSMKGIDETNTDQKTG